MSAAVGAVDFSRSMSRVVGGLIVKPLLENFIEQADNLCFPGVPARDLGTREPDGWFHPSTHPLWSDRALYEYLAHPDLMQGERMDVASKKSVTWGTAGHTFTQWCLAQTGVLPAELQQCQTCPPAARCREPGFVDARTGARTHADGVLALPGRYGQDLFEYKTGGESTWAAYRRLKDLEDLDLEAFRRAWPHYYAQAIELQRISGRRRTILLMEVWGHPWLTREFHIPYDPQLAAETRDKYLRVRQAVADQRPPRCPCATAERRTCPARKACR